MSQRASFKAIYAAQSILENTAQTSEEHFEYFEKNPQQSLLMLSYSKRNSHKIFKSIPKGREPEYIDIVKRAWKVLSLPPESNDYVAFINKFTVNGVLQVTPQKSFLNREQGLTNPRSTYVWVAAFVIFFLVIVPLTSWLNNKSSFLGFGAIALYMVLVYRWLKLVNNNVPNAAKDSIRYASPLKVQHSPVENQFTQTTALNEEKDSNNIKYSRQFSIQNSDARYDKNERSKSYLKN